MNSRDVTSRPHADSTPALLGRHKNTLLPMFLEDEEVEFKTVPPTGIIDFVGTRTRVRSCPSLSANTSLLLAGFPSF